jgi:hypothetical protein
MKTYWGSGVIAPRILDLGARWRWVANFTPRPLYPTESPWYLFDRRMDAVRKIKIPSLCRDSNSDHPAMPLSYPGSCVMTISFSGS